MAQGLNHLLVHRPYREMMHRFKLKVKNEKLKVPLLTKGDFFIELASQIALVHNTVGNRAAQGNLIGIFQLIANGHTTGNGGYFYI